MSIYGKSVCSLSGALALCAFSGASIAGEFDGVTVNILTRPGYVIAGRLAERGKEFEAATGGKIVVTEVPFAEIFPKIQNDWSTGTNSIDVGVFAAGWGVELDAAGLLEDMDPYIAKDTKIDLDDVAPYFREFGQKVGGKTKLLMVDGDFQMVYYRKDVLEKAGLQPPKTWEEYLDVASKIHGKDMNGDGEADYGSCIFKKRNAQSYFAIQTFAASHRADPGHGPGLPLRRRHDEAGHQQRWLEESLRALQGNGQVRSAGRAQHGHRRHPRAVQGRPLRPADRMGRSRHAAARSRRRQRQGHDLRRCCRRLEGSARPRHRQARAGYDGKRALCG